MMFGVATCKNKNILKIKIKKKRKIDFNDY